MKHIRYFHPTIQHPSCYNRLRQNTLGFGEDPPVALIGVGACELDLYLELENLQICIGRGKTNTGADLAVDETPEIVVV